MGKKYFSTFDIERILKIRRDRLYEWLRGGFIKPTVKASGRGTKAAFIRDDLYRVQLFRMLLNLGMTRNLAATFIDRRVSMDKRMSYRVGPLANWEIELDLLRKEVDRLIDEDTESKESERR